VAVFDLRFIDGYELVWLKINKNDILLLLILLMDQHSPFFGTSHKASAS
jgi:hypothetical protein